MKQESAFQMIVHPFPPHLPPNANLLILGSFPSVKSRECGFYYGHPNNRFWSVLAHLYGDPIPKTLEEKKALLDRNGIALWDVIASCEIRGSSDSSIRNAQINDISTLLQKKSISSIYTNGKTAQKLFEKYLPEIAEQATCLPSTSPANAAKSLEALIEIWSCIKYPKETRIQNLIAAHTNQNRTKERKKDTKTGK